MKYLLFLSLSLFLPSCVEYETPEFELFPEFEEEPRHGSLSDYNVDSRNIGLSGGKAVAGVYKGETDLRIIQAPDKMVALDPEDYSVRWAKDRLDLGDYHAPIFDYQGQLLIGAGNKLTQLDISSGETLNTIELWAENDGSREILALQVVDDLIYSFVTDAPNDSMYRLQIFEHRPEQNERESIFSLSQAREFEFYYPYMDTDDRTQELAYDEETDQFIFPLFVHDHEDYDYGIHAFTIDRSTHRVESDQIPVRFLETLRPEDGIRYLDGLLSFETSHLHVYSVNEKKLHWEVIGGDQQYKKNHVFQVLDGEARLFNIYSGEKVWSSEYSWGYIRRGVGINSEETYFFVPRRDRLSVYEMKTGELMVDFFSDVMDELRFFFDEKDRLVYINTQGLLLYYELDF